LVSRTRRTPKKPLAYAVLAAACALLFALGVGATLLGVR
jgi:hypothetical protein